MKVKTTPHDPEIARQVSSIVDEVIAENPACKPPFTPSQDRIERGVLVTDEISRETVLESAIAKIQP